MYPTISDLLNDLLGINIPLPIQSFGFFVALAFIVVGFVVTAEIKRRHLNNRVPVVKKKVTKGGKVKMQDWIITGVIGFALGFKLLDAVINYSAFSANPQSFILSLQGNFLGGLLGAGIGIYLKYRENKKEIEKYGANKVIEETVLPASITANILVLGAVFGLLGAKIFHNLEYIDDFMRDPIDAIFSFSGLTFYGGFIFAAVAIIWYVKTVNIKPWHICDITAPALALGYGIGRIGCHVAGDGDWGITNISTKPGWMNFLPDWVWAYNYPHNVINEGIIIDGCTGPHCHMLAQPVFPTPLWEAFLGIMMFVVLWSLRKRIKTAGVIFSLYMIMQGIERFFIEKIRVNSLYDIFGMKITQAEIISFVSILLGLAGVIYFLKNKEKYQNY